MTDTHGEAAGYARGGHLGGQSGNPSVYQVRTSPSGKTADINGLIQRALEDGDPEQAIIDIAPMLRKQGYSYVTYDHPSFSGGDDQRVIVALNPSKDLKIVGKSRAK